MSRRTVPASLSADGRLAADRRLVEAIWPGSSLERHNNCVSGTARTAPDLNVTLEPGGGNGATSKNYSNVGFQDILTI